MQHAQRLTLEQMREFVASSSSLTFTGADRKEIYGLVERVLGGAALPTAWQEAEGHRAAGSSTAGAG